MEHTPDQAQARQGYNAWLYVILAAYLAAIPPYLLLSWALPVLDGFSGAVLSAALPYWLFRGNWAEVERACGPYCSGCVNISIAYVPLLALYFALELRFTRRQGGC